MATSLEVRLEEGDLDREREERSDLGSVLRGGIWLAALPEGQ
jgi:hypothetical protein